MAEDKGLLGCSSQHLEDDVSGRIEVKDFLVAENVRDVGANAFVARDYQVAGEVAEDMGVASKGECAFAGPDQTTPF